MFTLVRLAFRNVLRNKSRAAFTLGGIAFGVWMSLLLGSFVIGLGETMADDVVRSKVGALQVHLRGYDDAKANQPLDFNMEEHGDVPRIALATPHVKAVAPHIVFGGLLNNGAASTMVIATGADPDAELKVLPLANRGLTGQPLSKDAPHAGLLGFELADAMGVKRGSTVTLQAASQAGQQNALDLDLAGTVNNNLPFDSKRMLWVPLAYAQELVQMPGRVTEFAIALDDIKYTDEVKEHLERALGPKYHVQTWYELRVNIKEVIQIQRIILMAACLVFLIIAVVGVMNTMLMSVLERTREIGTMMAVGVKRSQVTVLFLWEAAFLALLGAGIGAALGYGVVGIVVELGGVALTAPGSTMMVHIKPHAPLWLAAIAVVASALGTLAAAAYPAWRAARLRPVEALRAV